MLEARYMVPDSETIEKKIKPALVSAGAVCLGWYGLTDIMFAPRDKPADFNRWFVRLRVTRTSRTKLFPVIVVQKTTVWGAYAKQDILTSVDEFSDIASADAFIEKEFGNMLKKDFSFSRDGMRYALGNLGIFVEDILVPGIRWSVEIESPDDAAIATCAEMLGLGEPIRDSVPSLVRKHNAR